MNPADVFPALAAPFPKSAISWRQDGKPMTRDGRHFARFVCYIDANTVRERLDNTVPGSWNLSLELLPPIPGTDATDAVCAFKARMTVLDVTREDVGTGKDYKQAATDAFKRVAVRFGIGHELYSYELNWVEMDGDGKYAKPIEDPGQAYERRHGQNAPNARERVAQARPTSSGTTTPTTAAGDAGAAATGATAEPLVQMDAVACPKCGGRMWDNRIAKRNPKAPDYKCRDRSCDGVIWPPKNGGESQGTVMDEQDVPKPTRTRKESRPASQDEIPF